jgi:hypothetical protein
MPVSAAVVNQLTQLQAQQAAITEALRAMLEGTWTGEGSVEAFLYALNPRFQGTLTPKLPQYPGGATATPLFWDPRTPQPQQTRDWTCSACALAWVLRATGVDRTATEDTELAEIGQPLHINPTYGLRDGSGRRLREIYEDHGVQTSQGWLTFDQVWALAGETTGQLAGGGWYHWVALRGRDGDALWIANSARGYKGVSERLTREDFNRLGPFSVVWLTP